MVIDKLELKNINVINARAEEYAKDNREKYDIVTSRAVAPLKHLLEYSIPTLKINGNFISLKSNMQQPTVTGPANGPLPASSTPQIKLCPSANNLFS